MPAAKRFPARFRRFDRVIVRPRRHDRYTLRIDTFRHHTFLHEPIKYDRLCRYAKAVTQHALKQTTRYRIFFEPTGGNRFIGVEVHHPKAKPAAFDFDEKRSEKRDQRRWRKRDGQIETS